MPVQRIHQEPTIVFRPVAKARTALRDTLTKGQPILTAVEGKPNLVFRHSHEAATFPEEYFRVSQMIRRPMP